MFQIACRIIVPPCSAKISRRVVMRMKMTRSIVTGTLFVLGGLAALTAGAQPAAKPAKIGFLIPSTPVAAAQNVEGFRRGLRELGHVEGKTFVLELRYGEARAERLPDLARELMRLQLDVIVTATDLSAGAVKRETQTIPIVIPNSADPVGAGLVESLARPGGNITGLSVTAPELSPKRLQLLKEAVPRLSRVAFLWNPDAPGHTLQYKELEAAARSLGLQIQGVEVRRPADLEPAFSAVTRGRADALTSAWPNPVLFANRVQVASFALKNRLPSVSGQKELLETGGLMSYGPDLPDLYRRAATYVDKILKGAKPADLPVEQATKFELVINMKTAKALGITFPASILARADQIME